MKMRHEHDREVGVLREAVREAGQATASARWSYWALTAGVLGIPILVWGASNARYVGLPGGVETMGPLGVAYFTGFAAVVGGCVGLPLALGFRFEHRRRLRQRLAALPRDAVAEALLPLRGERGDTGKIAAALMRDFGMPTEVAPAVPADGDEVSPV
jgi:hypothetical protein